MKDVSKLRLPKSMKLSDYTISNDMQELFNKLEIGIAVFCAKSTDEFIPIFCNEGYLKLFDIEFPQFITQFVKKNNYGVHPEDIDSLRKCIVEAFQGDGKINYTFRLKTSKDIYKWMTTIGTIIEQSDGSYEIYMILSDAEKTVFENQIRAKRYKSLIEKTQEQSQDSLSVVHFNLTKDTANSIYRAISVNNGVTFGRTVDDFINSASKNVSYASNREDFLNTFSKAGLLRSFEKGVLSFERAVPITLSSDRIIWCKQMAKLTRNPESGDVECITSLVEDDKELRLKGYFKRIIDADYEFMGCINVKTRAITVMRAEKREAVPPRKSIAVEYNDRMGDVVASLISEDFVDECFRAVKLDRIINELESKDLYYVTFPAKKEVLGYDGAFQWEFGYDDSHKQEIIITRRETYSFLDKRQTIELPHDSNWFKNQEIQNAVGTGKLNRNKILIADDVEINRELIKIIFEKEFDVIQAADGQQAIQLIDENYDKLAIIFLDMNMPKKTGLDVLIHNKMRGYHERIPVILVTGSTTDELNLRSLNYGVSDIINKPFDGEIVKRRALNLIELYAHKEDTEMQLENWKRDAIEMHEQADKNNEVLINILSSVVEFRSFESGTHIKRVRALTEIMLKTWLTLYPDTTFDEDDIEQITRASAMHDIGKVAIPDNILQKPGRLTKEEFEIMKKHTVFGCAMLEQIEQEDSNLYRYCYDICRYHHERDDGRGYPDGLKGNDIPVWAKIVSIVDVFDALTSPRVYKEAYSPQKALDMIQNGECGVFAEDLLKCFEISYEIMVSTIEN